MTLQDKYAATLESVRQNPKLLDDYRFDKDASESKHFDRLRLNIAIYNDFKQSDYEIVKFLFTQEKEWRKSGGDGHVDNLYFCAFILTQFNLPEIIWQFFEVKNIDFDSGIGFDGEYLVSAGIDETYQYLSTADNSLKNELLKYIGETIDSCNYSQADIAEWKAYRKSYFRIFEFPTQDEQSFLYSTNERELFLTKLPEWIKQARPWTYEELGLFQTYAKYANDKALEIEALKLAIEKNDKEFLDDSYRRQLAGLYIKTGENERAFGILKNVIEETDNNNVVRDCVEQLCRLIIKVNNSLDEATKKSYELIVKQRKKYRKFSPLVDSLIGDATEIMRAHRINDHDNDLSKTRRSWWSKLFGID